MNSILFIDFETFSTVDLPVCGVDVYAKHPSTEATCMAWGFDDEPLVIWKEGQKLPKRVRDGILKGAKLVGHNVNFEWNIWNYVCNRKYGWPELKAEQLIDTMAMANAMGLPGSLGMAAPAAGLPIEKDSSAYRVMMQIATPKQRMADGSFTRWTYDEIPEKFEHLYRYCIQDTEVERALYKKLTKLNEKEQKIWLLDQKINRRGVGIDLPRAAECAQLVADEQAKLEIRLAELTGKSVPSFNSHVALKRWINDQGVKTNSCDKEAVTRMLDRTDLPEHVREALVIRRAAAKSSNAKLIAMLKGCTGGRARFTFEYYGAKQTGRWAGRRIQLHNMPRPRLKFSQIEDILSRLKTPEEIEMMYGDLMQVASDCLRAFLVPAKGNKFLAADFSNIEGRCLAWLADETWKLEAFRAYDADPRPAKEKLSLELYVLSYARAFGISPEEVTDDQRQGGKVMELSMGYQGWVGAFQNMAKNYGFKVSDEKAAELAKAWRNANPKIVAYWYSVDDAVRCAIKNKGSAYAVGKGAARILFKVVGSFLCTKLPSGRIMYYPYPDLQRQVWVALYDPKAKKAISKAFIGKTDKLAEEEAVKHAKKKKYEVKEFGDSSQAIVYKSYDTETKQWGYTATYGGSIVENLCQGISRDVLAEAMLRLDAKGYPIVVHVHDEIVSEVRDVKENTLLAYERLMSQPPEWAAGFPIVAKGWEDYRFRKG